MRSHARFLASSTAPESIRREMMGGREHLVVPIIALVEGVLQCAVCPDPELVMASEFSNNLDSWNGRPITMGHPKRNGQYVSAGSPDIFEKEGMGFMFNASVSENKLKVEAWIDLAKVEDSDDENMKSTVKRLEEGEQVEISTGYFADVDPHTGKFNGKSYKGIQRDIVPDHLALLHEGDTGACSWEDGCGGPRVNMTCNCGGTCTKCQKKEKKPLSARSILDRALRAFGFKSHEELLPQEEIKANESFDDIRVALESVLYEEEGKEWSYITHIYDDKFVYVLNGKVYERTYAINDGSITMGKEDVAVRRVTEFIPVKVNEETEMAKKEKIDALIANKATKFTEKDRKFLEGLEEDQLALMEPAEQTAELTTDQLSAHNHTITPPAPAPAPHTHEVTQPEPKKPATVDEYIADAPEEVREVLNSGLQMHRARKDTLVNKLKTHKSNAFTEDELKAMNVSQLERLAKLAGEDEPEADYSARGGPRTNSAEDDAIPAPIAVFPMKKEA